MITCNLFPCLELEEHQRKHGHWENGSKRKSNLPRQDALPILKELSKLLIPGLRFWNAIQLLRYWSMLPPAQYR